MIFENERTLVLLINEMARYKKLTEQRQRSYILAYQKYGDSYAIEQVVKNNMNFVVLRARKYIRTNINILDLISEGLIGVLEACSKYDYESKKVKFLSYAGWYIDKRMKEFINENILDFHVPLNVIVSHYVLLKENDKHIALTGDPISDSDMFEKGFNVNELEKARSFTNSILNRNARLHSNNTIMYDESDADLFDSVLYRHTRNNESFDINEYVGFLDNQAKVFLLDFNSLLNSELEKKYCKKYKTLLKEYGVLIKKIKLYNEIA